MDNRTQVRFYMDNENLAFIEQIKNNENFSDFLNNIIKSYKELHVIKNPTSKNVEKNTSRK